MAFISHSAFEFQAFLGSSTFAEIFFRLFGNSRLKYGIVSVSMSFKLSSNIISRVNPLQPWPTPIKAKLSYSNFSLAWISSLLVLIGIFQITLGGIGLSGFFTLRELYFISSNTFEALIKLGTGLLLLNLTIRRVDLKYRILLISAALQAVILISRNRMFGFAVANGITVNDYKQKNEHIVEGIDATSAVYKLSSRMNISMPICKTIYEILFEDLTPKAAAKKLMSRAIQQE